MNREQRELHDRAVELHALAHFPDGVNKIYSRLHNKRPPFICCSWEKTLAAKLYIEEITTAGMTFSRTGPSGEHYYVGDPAKESMYREILYRHKAREKEQEEKRFINEV